ncbi:unnamed protein product, partial [Amoebophrya sp. A25]
KIAPCDEDADGSFSEKEIACVVQKGLPTAENMGDSATAPEKPSGSGKSSETLQGGGLLPVNLNKAATRAEDLQFPPGADVSRRMRETLFSRLDSNGDGKVTPEEAMDLQGRQKAEQFRQIVDSFGSSDGAARKEEYAQMVQKTAPDGELAECMFLYRDLDQDGKLTRTEASLPDAQVALAHEEQSCGGRMLMEAMVHKPRRRLQEKKNFEIEKGLRIRMLREKGAGAPYDRWLERRRLKSEGEHAEHRRQLEGIQSGIDRRRRQRRQLTSLTAAEQETLGGGLAHNPGTAPGPVGEAEELQQFKSLAYFSSLSDADLRNFDETFQSADRDEFARIKEDLKTIVEAVTCHNYRRVLADEPDEMGVRPLIGVVVAKEIGRNGNSDQTQNHDVDVDHNVEHLHIQKKSRRLFVSNPPSGPTEH